MPLIVLCDNNTAGTHRITKESGFLFYFYLVSGQMPRLWQARYPDIEKENMSL